MKFDRQEMEETLAGLEAECSCLTMFTKIGPEVFESRWAMSYLRGPLTRTQIKTLMDPIKEETQVVAQAKSAAAGASVSSGRGSSSANTIERSAQSQSRPPVLPPEVSQYFIPVRSSGAQDSRLIYHPMVLGAAAVRFSNKNIDTSQDLTMLAPISDGAIPVEWDQSTQLDIPVSDLEEAPQSDAQFADLPGVATKKKSYDSWKKDFAAWLYRNQKLELLRSPRLAEVSNPNESERDFRIRLQQSAREKRDEAVDRLRQKYAPKIAALEEKNRRASQAVAREAEQAKDSKMQTAISFGAAVLSSFMGRKSISMTTLGRATTAARGVGRSMKEAQDVGRAQETVAAVTQQLADLDAEFKAETDAIERSVDSQTEPLETISLKPTKTNISVSLLNLAWAPYWHDAQGAVTPGWE